MLFPDLHELRHLFLAVVRPERTARVEGAALRDVDQVRRNAFNDFQLRLSRLVKARHRFQQPNRVGVPWAFVEGGSVGGLDDLTRIHHVHAVRVARDDAQVVGDDDDGGTQLAAEPREDLQHLRLDRYVERRRRLVREQELGVA